MGAAHHEVVRQLIQDMGDELGHRYRPSFFRRPAYHRDCRLARRSVGGPVFVQNVVDHPFLPLPKENVEDVQDLKRQAAKNYYSYLYPHVVHKKNEPCR
ncbi:hypothetical protein VQ056_12320 [Paenibacillus sp. JTLBN-2024]